MKFKRFIPTILSTSLVCVAPLFGSCSSNRTSSWDVMHGGDFHAKFDPLPYKVVKSGQNIIDLYFDAIEKHPRIFADDLVFFNITDTTGEIPNLTKVSVTVRDVDREKYLISFDMNLEFFNFGYKELVNMKWNKVSLGWDGSSIIEHFGRPLVLNSEDFQKENEEWSVEVDRRIGNVEHDQYRYNHSHTFWDDSYGLVSHYVFAHFHYIKNIYTEEEVHD